MAPPTSPRKPCSPKLASVLRPLFRSESEWDFEAFGQKHPLHAPLTLDSLPLLCTDVFRTIATRRALLQAAQRIRAAVKL